METWLFVTGSFTRANLKMASYSYVSVISAYGRNNKNSIVVNYSEIRIRIKNHSKSL